MKTKIILHLVSIFLPVVLLAQTDADALRFSQTNMTGTARSTSMAGAFGAIGADFSSLSINPAGLAIYRKPEITMSPAVFSKKTNSSFFGNRSLDEKYGFNFGNLGLIATAEQQNYAKHGWKFLNFGVGYNRLSSYSSHSTYAGVNPDNSYLDYFLQNINTPQGTKSDDLNPFFENLAYQTFLLNPKDSIDTLHYSSEIPFGGALQRRNATSSGAMREIAVSIAGNYKDRLFLGATLGFDFISYTENSSYEESDKLDTIPRFKSFAMNQDLTTDGQGFNLKLGMIFKATDWLRLGAAVTTPTSFEMSDNYRSRLKSEFDNGDKHDFQAKGDFTYELTTPLKATASAAVIIQKQAVISVDYELMNYAEMNFGSSSDAFFDINNSIQNKYTQANNIRIGGEWKFENFSFRGGYAMLGSPFRSGVSYPGADFSRTCYTAGIGLRDERYFLDFAYSITLSNEFYRQYSLKSELVEGAKSSVSAQNFIMTLGFKF